MKLGSSPETTTVSLKDTFRLIFVIYFLYLIGDGFYRWDGFKYYGYFTEFVPSAALIIILWSIVAAISTFFIWLFIRVSRLLPLFIRRIVNAEFILIFFCLIIMSVMIAFLGKRFLIGEILTFWLRKHLSVYLMIGAAVLSWMLRNKIDGIQERLTPLVWLFGITVILSVPVVAYRTFFTESESEISIEIVQSHSHPNKIQQNIIFVIFDAMTAQDMSLYGYRRETTPFISEWAKGAAVFTGLESASNWTPPTVSSIMTGKRVWTHQVYQPFSNKIKKGDTESLPLVLRENGYYTMAYVTNNFSTIKNLGLKNGFDVDYPVSTFQARKSLMDIIEFSLNRLFFGKIKLYDWLTQKDFIFYKAARYIAPQLTQAGDDTRMNRMPEIAFNKFLNDINHDLKYPYFAWIHIYPPHDPYLPPEPYMGMFDSSPRLRTATSQENVKDIHQRYRNRIMQSRLHEILPDINILRARYDEDIAYCDKQFEHFIHHLEAGDKLKNTIIILSSDHGESFEHIKVGHGDAYLYEQLTHIPLIIKEPGEPGGKVINNIIEQIDIPATILDLAGIPAPSWMEGRSFKPLLRGESLHHQPVFSMNFESNPGRGEKINDGVIAVWEDDYKMIHYLGSRKDHIFDNSSLLFNLKEDPDELINLFDKEPERSQHMLSLIQDNLKQANERLRIGE